MSIEQNRRISSPARQSEYLLLYPPEITRHPAPWSVEIWRPFADRRLHEYLMAIPPEQKFRPHPDTDNFYAGAKRILRQSMAGIVPDSIRTRTTKTVFDHQIQNQVDVLWPEYERAFSPGASPEIVAQGYVDRDHFWNRLVQFRQGDVGPDLPYLLRMIDLETWLRSLQQPREAIVRVAGSAAEPEFEVATVSDKVAESSVTTVGAREGGSLRAPVTVN